MKRHAQPESINRLLARPSLAGRNAGKFFHAAHRNIDPIPRHEAEVTWPKLMQSEIQQGRYVQESLTAP